MQYKQLNTIKCKTVTGGAMNANKNIMKNANKNIMKEQYTNCNILVNSIL